MFRRAFGDLFCNKRVEHARDPPQWPIPLKHKWHHKSKSSITLRGSSRENDRYQLDCLRSRAPSRPRAVMDAQENVKHKLAQFEQRTLTSGVKSTSPIVAESPNPFLSSELLQLVLQLARHRAIQTKLRCINA